MDDNLLKLLSEQIAQLDYLKDLKPWNSTYEVWLTTTEKLLRELLGEEYVRKFRGQKSVVIEFDEIKDRISYKNQLDRMKEFLEAVIKDHARLKVITSASKDSAGDSKSKTINESLFQPATPEKIANALWWWKIAESFLVKKIPNPWLRRSLIGILFIIIAVILLKFSVPFFRDTGHFEYQPDEITYASKSPQQPGVVNVLFQADVRNLSSSPRYLRNFVDVVPKNSNLGSTWQYQYSSDVGEVYTVEGATDTPIMMPVLFEPNESKTLQWRFSINATDDPDVIGGLSEQTCKGVF